MPRAHFCRSTNRKSYFTNLPGTKYKLIAEPLRNVFKNKQITCVEYEDLTAEQEREIFQVRVNPCAARISANVHAIIACPIGCLSSARRCAFPTPPLHICVLIPL